MWKIALICLPILFSEAKIIIPRNSYAECLIFTNIVSDSRVSEIEDYLSNKWGIPVPNKTYSVFYDSSLYSNTNKVKAVYQGKKLIYNPEKKNYLGYIWTPEDLGNRLTLWLSDASIHGSPGSSASYWPDVRGTSYCYSTNGWGNPLVSTNSYGRKCVYFDGVDDGMKMCPASLLMFSAKPHAYIFASCESLSPASGSSYQYITGFTTSSGLAFAALYARHLSASGTMSGARRLFSDASASLAYPSKAANGWNVYGGDYNWYQGIHRMWWSGSWYPSSFSSSGLSDSGYAAACVIGTTGDVNTWLKGRVGEILFIVGDLTDYEIRKITDYLADKWK